MLQLYLRALSRQHTRDNHIDGSHISLVQYGIKTSSLPMPPAISIAMPTRGRVPYVQRAIRSVLDQSFSSFELLILDNSAPAEKQQIRNASHVDPRIVFVDRGNTGVTEARRLGARLSRGKLFALMDSDDYWDRRRLEKHMLVWRDNRIGLSWDRWAEAAGETINEFAQPFREGLILPPKVAAKLYRSNFIHASAGIVSVSFAKDFGFPLLGIMSSDWTLFMRAAEDFPAYFIGECLAFKETESPDRVSDLDPTGFFIREATTIRHWAVLHRPRIYAREYVKGRSSRFMKRIRRM